MTWFRAGCGLAVAAVCASGCGARLMKLPAGPGTAAADGREAIAEAVGACQRITTLTAVIGVTGSIAGERVRGRLLAGVARPASARIEATAPVGAPIFIFVARDGDATLLLPRDDRVLEHGDPAAVLEAAAGVPLDPSQLRAALTGCAQAPDSAGARTLGEDWRVVRDGPGELYLHRDRHGAPWRIVAEVRPEWRAEYRDFQNDLPRTIRLRSGGAAPYDLTLALSQVEVNTTLAAEAFSVQVPASARPITVDELRHARPGVRQD